VSLTAADQLEILQLVARADGRATARDADGYVALYTEDALMEGDEGTVYGVEALREDVARVWALELPGTLHLTLNAVVHDTAPNPTVTSVLLLLAPADDGTSIDAAHIRQVVRRTREGWRIQSRTIRAWGVGAG
jgi:ketosteroid isomerase-like protein